MRLALLLMLATSIFSYRTQTLSICNHVQTKRQAVEWIAT